MHTPSKPENLSCWLNLAAGLRPAQFTVLRDCGARPPPLPIRYHAGLSGPCRAASTCCSLTSSSEFPSSYLDDRLEGITKKGKHGYLPNPYYCFSKKFSNSLLQPNSIGIGFLPQVTVIPLLTQDIISASHEDFYLLECHKPMLVFLTLIALRFIWVAKIKHTSRIPLAAALCGNFTI